MRWECSTIPGIMQCAWEARREGREVPGYEGPPPGRAEQGRSRWGTVAGDLEPQGKIRQAAPVGPEGGGVEGRARATFQHCLPSTAPPGCSRAGPGGLVWAGGTRGGGGGQVRAGCCAHRPHPASSGPRRSAVHCLLALIGVNSGWQVGHTGPSRSRNPQSRSPQVVVSG